MNGNFIACDKVLETIEGIIIGDEDLMDLVAFVLDGENEEWAMLQIIEGLSKHGDAFPLHTDEILDGTYKVIDKLRS